MTHQESLPLLPGEDEMMRESVVAGGPSVMKSAKGTKSTAPPAASIRSTPSPTTSMKPSPMLSSNKPVQLNIVALSHAASLFVCCLTARQHRIGEYSGIVSRRKSLYDITERINLSSLL